MIPPVEERQVRPCMDFMTGEDRFCAFFDERIDCFFNPSRWKEFNDNQFEFELGECELSPCVYHMYESEIKLLIDQHNQKELK